MQDKGKGIVDDNNDEDDVDVIEETIPKSSSLEVKPTVQEVKERVNEAINQENEKREANLLNQRKLKFPLWRWKGFRRRYLKLQAHIGLSLFFHSMLRTLKILNSICQSLVRLSSLIVRSL